MSFLDTCFTDNVFNNCSVLGDIIACDVDDDLEMQCNGGSMTYGLKSTMKLFPLEVAYNENSVGNVISFFHLARVPGVVITLDSRVHYGFNVTYLGKLYRFLPFDNGLCYFDARTEPMRVEDNDKKLFPLTHFYSPLRTTKLFTRSVKLKERRMPVYNKKPLGG